MQRREGQRKLKREKETRVNEKEELEFSVLTIRRDKEAIERKTEETDLEIDLLHDELEKLSSEINQIEKAKQKEERMLQTLTKEVDDLEHELQDKITEQARAQVAFQMAQAASVRNRETLGAPNLLDFQKMISGATQSANDFDFRKHSVDSVALLSLDDNMSQGNFSSRTPRAVNQPGIYEEASSHAATERYRFSSVNMSTLDGDEFVQFDDGPMDME